MKRKSYMEPIDEYDVVSANCLFALNHSANFFFHIQIGDYLPSLQRKQLASGLFTFHRMSDQEQTES